jgi:two-component system, response regulator YesN
MAVKMLKPASVFLRNFMRKKWLSHIILSYFVLAFILFLTFSVVLSSTYYRAAMKNAELSSQKLINQSYNTANITIYSTYNNFYTLFYQNSDLYKALYTKSFSYSDVTEIHNMITQQTFSNSIVDSIYIYNRGADKIFSNFEDSSLSDFYDKDFIGQIKKLDADNNSAYISRKEVMPSNATKNVISMFFLNFNVIGQVDSAMAVNIDQKSFQQMVSGGTQGNISIIDDKGIIISDPDSSKINESAKNINYYNKILHNKANSGYLIDNIGNEKCFISYFKFPGLSWTFLDITNYETLIQGYNNVKFYAFMLTMAFLILGIIISAFFTGNIYSPINRLLHELKSKSEDNSTEQNEFDYFSNAFHQLYGQLESNKYKYSNKKRSELTIKILDGELASIEEANKFLIDDKFNTESPLYVVLVLRFDSFNKLNDKYCAQDIYLYKYALVNISEELFGRQYCTDGVINGTDYVSLLINLTGCENDSSGFLTQTAKELQQNIKKYFDFSITVSIGKAVNSFGDIHKSYKSALQASDYRLFTGKESVIQSDLLAADPATFQYTVNEEKQLISAIRQKNINKSFAALTQFMAGIRKYNPDEIMITVTQLLITLLKTFSNINFNTYDKSNTNFSMMIDKLNDCETLDEISDNLKGVIIQIVGILSNDVIDKKKQFAESVLNYINEHYSNPELTVDILSKHVGFSPNYLRSIFKEIQGISVTDYLTELRIKKVKEMLINTDLSAKEISAKVGFADNHYFYVVFKKIAGCTSEEFRSRNKKNI